MEENIPKTRKGDYGLDNQMLAKTEEERKKHAVDAEN